MLSTFLTVYMFNCTIVTVYVCTILESVSCVFSYISRGLTCYIYTSRYAT